LTQRPQFHSTSWNSGSVAVPVRAVSTSTKYRPGSRCCLTFCARRISTRVKSIGLLWHLGRASTRMASFASWHRSRAANGGTVKLFWRDLLRSYDRLCPSDKSEFRPNHPGPHDLEKRKPKSFTAKKRCFGAELNRRAPSIDVRHHFHWSFPTILAPRATVRE